MLKLSYKRLPKGTPQWLTVSILLLGGGLGLSISAQALIALYGLNGFLSVLFFPAASFVIDANEAIYLGVTGVSAALGATLLSYLAVYMNSLSRRAIPLSRIVWIPLLTTTVLVIVNHLSTDFMYNFSTIWVIGTIASVVLGGVLPWLLLRTSAGRRVHNR